MFSRLPSIVALLATTLTFGALRSQDSIHVQVKLRRPSSITPVTGQQAVVLRLFDARTGGNPVWGPWSTTVTPDKAGVVSMIVGDSTTPLGMAVLQGQTKYLEFQVGGETLTPRLALFPQGLSGRRGRKVCKGCRVFKGSRVRRETKETKASQGNRVKPVSLDPLGTGAFAATQQPSTPE